MRYNKGQLAAISAITLIQSRIDGYQKTMDTDENLYLKAACQSTISGLVIAQTITAFEFNLNLGKVIKEYKELIENDRQNREG